MTPFAFHTTIVAVPLCGPDHNSSVSSISLTALFNRSSFLTCSSQLASGGISLWIRPAFTYDHDSEHLLVIWISSLEKHLFKSLVHL